MTTPVDDAAFARFVSIREALTARWPESHLSPTLDRIRMLVDLLGDPQNSIPAVHVAGTNGKTSTVRMIDAILREFGLHTGRYTSPHVNDMRERISFDGRPIGRDRFVAAYDDLALYLDLVDARNAHPLSFFEVMTALAFVAFADAPVDASVIEVGMGGRWDATNVVDARVAVIAPISLDHTAYLGDTLDAIAFEKAGIIKPEAIAVVGDQAPEALDVLLRKADEVGTTTYRAGRDFGVMARNVAIGGQLLTIKGIAGTYDEIFVPLHGEYQARNAALAVAAVESFLGGASGGLDAAVVREAFASVSSPGRLEIVRRSPTVIVDAAHNPAGAAALADAIEEEFSFDRLVGVIGVLADKDFRSMLEVLEPVLAEVVVTQPDTARALPVDSLAEAAVDIFGADRVEVVPRLPEALDAAVRLADVSTDVFGGGGVLVTGSVVTVGQARALFGARDETDD